MKFIRYYNQNRREIIIIVIAIIIGIVFLRLINQALVNNKTNTGYETENLESVEEVDENISIQVDEKEEESTSSDTDIETMERTIETFIGYLNNSETNNAYEMLSNECKEEIFPSIDDFITGYYELNFETQKTYDIYEWSGNTYKIDLKENALYSGKASNETKQDYITVITQDGKYKLNINSYVGRNELDISSTSNNVEVNIIQKDTYMSYEIYTLKVKNNNDVNLYLDDLINTDTIYITDTNNINYIAYMNELTKEGIKIYKHSSIEIKIKFMSSYISSKTITKITFSNVILENEEESVEISIEI